MTLSLMLISCITPFDIKISICTDNSLVDVRIFLKKWTVSRSFTVELSNPPPPPIHPILPQPDPNQLFSQGHMVPTE